MPLLPARFAPIVLAVTPLIAHRSWRHARVLIGAFLTPGRSRERRFVNVHRTLTRCSAPT